jgi:hypothetical protein
MNIYMALVHYLHSRYKYFIKSINFHHFLLILFLLIFSNLLNADSQNTTSTSSSNSQTKELSLTHLVQEKAFLKLLNEDILPYIKQKDMKSPSCFFSYAWGEPAHEVFVLRLAEMLEKAGFTVLLDRWEDRRGKYLTNFIEKIENADWVIVVGTPLYLVKYNRRAQDIHHREHVVRLEAQLVNYLISFNEKNADRIIPVLLEGTSEVSFPFLLRPKLAADFTKNNYFEECLKLIHDLYGFNNRDKTFEEYFTKMKRYSSLIGSQITEEKQKEYEKQKREENLKLEQEIERQIKDFKADILSRS